MIECKIENVTKEGARFYAMLSFFDSENPGVEVGQRRQVDVTDLDKFALKAERLTAALQDEIDGRAVEVKAAAEARLSQIMAARRAKR